MTTYILNHSLERFIVSLKASDWFKGVHKSVKNAHGMILITAPFTTQYCHFQQICILGLLLLLLQYVS